MATNNDMEARLERVETKVDRVEAKVDGLKARFDKLETKVDEFQNATKVQFEGIREDIKKLGEGYEQGLKEVSRQIKEVAQGWHDKWEPHDLALQDHGRRISALERGGPAARRRR